jgi:hypothetical protein
MFHKTALRKNYPPPSSEENDMKPTGNAKAKTKWGAEESLKIYRGREK